MNPLELVFPAFQLGVDDPALAERWVDLGAGGFCLFSGTLSETRELTQRLQRRARGRLIFCADYEEGLAPQLGDGLEVPSAMGLAATGEESAACEAARLVARQARSIGVGWIFAPVADLASRPENPIVNIRAFSDAPAVAAKFAAAVLHGFHAEKAAGCLKHFPGHGDTALDTHLELARIERGQKELEALELAPFRACIPLADSVMTGHLLAPALDPKRPVSLSAAAIDGALRGQLKHQGVVVTDSLRMSALEGQAEEPALAALAAGNDVLLMPPDPADVLQRLPGRVQSDPELTRRAAAASVRLERLRNVCAGPAEPCDAGELEKSARRLFEKSICILGQDKPLSGQVLYLEPDCDDPQEWRGAEFVAALRKHGVRVEPYREGAGGAVLVGTFQRPRPYCGTIALPQEEAARAGAALKARGGWLLSFGSPFVLDQVGGWTTGLCSFGDGVFAQHTAAAAATGFANARGKMPVTLRCLETISR